MKFGNFASKVHFLKLEWLEWRKTNYKKLGVFENCKVCFGDLKPSTLLRSYNFWQFHTNSCNKKNFEKSDLYCFLMNPRITIKVTFFSKIAIKLPKIV